MVEAAYQELNQVEYRTLQDFYEIRGTILAAVVLVVGPSKNWPGTVMLFWKVLGSLLVMLPLYWVMVTAFHLLNLPSDHAVLGGVCLLLATAAGGFVAFRKIWRM
jgi:hypothetical protein